MANKKQTTYQNIQDAIASGKTAKDECRYDDAISNFQTALKMKPTAADEAEIRCQLSETYERRGMNREQLETVIKYDNALKLSRFSDMLQINLRIQLGRAYAYNNDVPRAIGLLNQALSLAYQSGSDKAVGDCHHGLCGSYIQISEMRIARDYCESALEHYRRVGVWREIALCYNELTLIQAHEGDFQAALQYSNQIILLIGEKKDHDLLGRAYYSNATLSIFIEAPNEIIIENLEKAIRCFSENKNEPFLASGYNTLAYFLMLTGDLNRAEKISRSAIQKFKNSTRLRYLGGLFDTLAQIHLLQGKLQDADAAIKASKDAFTALTQNSSLIVADEIILNITTGRKYLLQGELQKAFDNLRKALQYSATLKEKWYAMEAQIWLAEALLIQGDLEAASKITEQIHTEMNQHPNLAIFGFLARIEAKIAARHYNFAAAIQSLEQSNSLFEIRENKYQRAVNRIVLAEFHEKQGSTDEAINETEQALSVFEKIGAALDARKTKEFLEHLKSQIVTTSSTVDVPDFRRTPDLTSSINGYAAQRILQASISRKLLLHELAAIAISITSSKAALVFESKFTPDEAIQSPMDFTVSAVVGLQGFELPNELAFINKTLPEEYSKHFIYEFTDNQNSKFLLHLIEPEAKNFILGKTALNPLLHLVQHSLELNHFRINQKKPRVFNQEEMLAQIKIPGFICASRAMTRVLEQIHKIRSSNVTVLITGESGTGKELIARAIHQGSSRRTNKFIPFNCSAAPRDLIESQLFGHRKGAFSGAANDHRGIIKTANHGTLFLDEVGDLPIDLQPKLLRFLQEGEILALGENEPELVDVRVVAATNARLEAAVAQGRFREDLFHRLNVIRIQMPPLRERREEIPPLLNHYLKEYAEESAKSDIQLAEETVDLMVVYDWPGNVRQLCNEVRRIVAYSDSGSIVAPDSLSPEIITAGLELQKTAKSSLKTGLLGSEDYSESTIQEATDELERRMIQEALRRSEGNIAQAAKKLGLSRMGLYLKMNRLNLQR